MGFQINGQDPPEGGHPRGNSAPVQYPQPTGSNGLGQPVGVVGRPFLELEWGRMNRAAWNWYMSFVGSAPSATLTQLRAFNAHKTGGAGWQDYSSAIMHQPRASGNAAGGAMTGVKILFTELVES